MSKPGNRLGGLVEPDNVIPIFAYRPLFKVNGRSITDPREAGKYLVWSHELKHVFDLYTTEFGYSVFTLRFGQFVDFAHILSGVGFSDYPVCESKKEMGEGATILFRDIDQLLECWYGILSSLLPDESQLSIHNRLVKEYGEENSGRCVVGNPPTSPFAILGARSLLECSAELFRLASLEEIPIGRTSKEGIRDSVKRKLETTLTSPGIGYYYGMPLDIMMSKFKARRLLLFSENKAEEGDRRYCLVLRRNGTACGIDLQISLEKLLVFMHRCLSPDKSGNVKWHPGICYEKAVELLVDKQEVLDNPVPTFADEIFRELGWMTEAEIMEAIKSNMETEMRSDTSIQRWKTSHLSSATACLEAVLQDPRYLTDPWKLLTQPPLEVHPTILPMGSHYPNIYKIDYLNLGWGRGQTECSEEALGNAVKLVVQQFLIKTFEKLVYDRDKKLRNSRKLFCPIHDFLDPLRELNLAARIWCPYINRDPSDEECYYDMTTSSLSETVRRGCFFSYVVEILQKIGLIIPPRRIRPSIFQRLKRLFVDHI